MLNDYCTKINITHQIHWVTPTYYIGSWNLEVINEAFLPPTDMKMESLMHLGLPQVKCRLLLSSIFYAMNF